MPHPIQSGIFILPERPEPEADARLRALLYKAADGAPGHALRIDVRARRRLDLPLLQLLLMAHRHWQARGNILSLTGLDPDQMARLRLLGLLPDHLTLDHTDPAEPPVFASSRGGR